MFYQERHLTHCEISGCYFESFLKIYVGYEYALYLWKLTAETYACSEEKLEVEHLQLSQV